MSQEIRNIPIESLVLWTENPRDPVDASLTDREVILRAISNESGNWNLDRLIQEMGGEYHYNEIPVVVMIQGSPIVFDGNRRVAAMKCMKDPDLYQVAIQKLPLFKEGEFNVPDELPCDVCDRETALNIVERLHSGSKRWGSLQYEQFKHIHRGAPKGRLMILDEASGGIVSRTKELNEEYAQNRLINESNLNKVGLSMSDEKLFSSMDDETTKQLIEDIADVAIQRLSTARHNPGDLRAALTELAPKRYEDIKPFDADNAKPVDAPDADPDGTTRKDSRIRRRRRIADAPKAFDGEVLRPNGKQSDAIYRAIEWIDNQYRKNPENRSDLLPILGFSLRILLETVAREYYLLCCGKDFGDDALGKFMKEVVKPLARKTKEADIKNYLSLEADWISERNSFEAVLHKWAHGTMSVNHEDFVKQSRIIAEVIKQVHWAE